MVNNKVAYLVTNIDKKAPMTNFYSLPTKCSVCHSFQEPQPISVQYNTHKDAKVLFRCVEENCKSSFTALYLKGSYGKEWYHFVSFI